MVRDLDSLGRLDLEIKELQKELRRMVAEMRSLQADLFPSDHIRQRPQSQNKLAKLFKVTDNIKAIEKQLTVRYQKRQTLAYRN